MKYSGFAMSFCRSGICKQAEKKGRGGKIMIARRGLFYINVCGTDKAALFPHLGPVHPGIPAV